MTSWYGIRKSKQRVIMQTSDRTACTIVPRELFTAVYCSSEQHLGPGGQLGNDAGQSNSMKIMTSRNDTAPKLNRYLQYVPSILNLKSDGQYDFIPNQPRPYSTILLFFLALDRTGSGTGANLCHSSSGEKSM